MKYNVGDTELDMEAALAVGISFVYAEYGFGNVSNIKSKISCISDLLKIEFNNL